MLFEKLQAIIPNPNSEFPKLNGNGHSYIFDRWFIDLKSQNIMYYKFPSADGKKMNKKRIFINELESLLGFIDQKRITLINRSLFSEYCPKTKSNGWCGYAVALRIFEYLNLGNYIGAKGFQLKL